tara:strand:+ start:3745 stop:4491 length:747 start_codon:yes stop_codon:yes gene_type:complete
MAEIKFYANETSIAGGGTSTEIKHTSGSGIGFFGGGFGISVPVGQYQDTTYVTNGDGTASGIRCKNTKWVSSDSIPNSGVSANGGSTIGLSGMPNYYAPLNIRFTHSEAVRVQNCKMRIFDRNDISKQASGVSTKVFECRHPQPNEAHNGQSGTLAMRGVTNYAWTEFDPAEAMSDLDFTASPGMSGLNTSAADTLPSGLADGSINWLTNQGTAHQSTRHDWYLAISASPDSIGSKTQYGLYFTLEYL